jgi:hypothetical protein
VAEQCELGKSGGRIILCAVSGVSEQVSSLAKVSMSSEARARKADMRDEDWQSESDVNIEADLLVQQGFDVLAGGNAALHRGAPDL